MRTISPETTRTQTDCNQSGRNRRTFRNYSVFGTVSNWLAGGSCVMLLATALGMNNSMVTLIGNLPLLSFLCLPAGYWLAAKYGTVCSLRLARWVSVAGIFLQLASILICLHSPLWSHPVLLVGTLIYYLGTGASAAMVFPIQSNICPAAELSHYLAEIGSLSHIMSVCALLFASGTFQLISGLWAYFVLFTAGAFSVILSACSIRNFHAPAILQQIVGEPLLPQIRLALRHSVCRMQLLCGFYLNLAMATIVPACLLTAKRGCGISAAFATVLTMLQLLSAWGMCPVWRRGAEKYGSDRMMIVGWGISLAICVFWLVFPGGGNGWLVIPFLLSGTLTPFISTSLGDYFARTVPPRIQKGGSWLVFIFTGGIVGLTGIGLCALIFTAGEMLHCEGMAGFRFFFLVMFLVMFPGIWLLRRLKNIAAKK